MANDVQKIHGLLDPPGGQLDFLDKLDADAAARLLAQLQDAQQAHHQHIEDSMQEALNHFPRLLRGPVKKIFGM